jgi:hypothetical protein
MLDDVLRRVSPSPLYDPGRVHHVFLCDTSGLYAFLALWAWKTGGIAQTLLDGHVFIRPHDIARGTVFGRSGEAKGGRSLAYFISHEVAHAMSADHVGRWRYERLATFQTEGYADYVGFARHLDLRAERQALVGDAPEMSPQRSGLYRRYETLVDYLLDRRGLSADDLLAQPMDQEQLEAELRADSKI